MVICNPRPTYYTLPVRSTANPRKILPNRVAVYELRGGETNHMFTIGTMGLQLDWLLKRGIPLEDAKSLFYEITS